MIYLLLSRRGRVYVGHCPKPACVDPAPCCLPLFTCFREQGLGRAIDKSELWLSPSHRFRVGALYIVKKLHRISTAALLLPRPSEPTGRNRVLPANRRVTDGARTRDLRSHNPPTLVSRCCPSLQNRLIYADFLAHGCPLFLGVALSVVSAVVSNGISQPSPHSTET